MAGAPSTTIANNNPLSSPSSTPSPSSSPRSLSLTRTESPPWTQIVRGQESESPPIMAERNCSSEENSDNVGGGKKQAWNKKPANGPVENGGGPGLVVMGPSEAWPALSESTNKASPKISSSSSIDFGSISSPQVTGTESSSLSTSSSSVQSQSQSSSTSQKFTTSNLNHGRPARQKSMKHDGGGNPHTNGGFSHQLSSPAEGMHNHTFTNPTTGGGSEDSGKDIIQNHRDSGPSGDHHQPRNSFRKGSGGSHSREGSHQNYGGRRGDKDRGNHDWNNRRSFNGRDATMQQRVSPRGFRPPSVSTPFVHPAPMRPTFVNPMGVAEVPMFYLPGVPLIAPVPGPMFIHPAPDPQLYAKIVNQIDYYFSNENLVKDTYLRQNMDEHGWVPVSLIASFKKVMQLTESTHQMLDALRSSPVVEIQGDSIRRRGDWERWIMPSSVQFSTASGSQSPKSPTVDTLSAQMQNVKVNEKTIDHVATISRSADLNSPSQGVSDGGNSSGC